MRNIISSGLTIVLVGTLLGTSLGTATALADTDVGGWKVSSAPDKDGACLATRAYVDAADDNRKNSVVFGLVKDGGEKKMFVVFGYESWDLDKGSSFDADVIVDGKTVLKKAKVEGDGKVATIVVDDADAGAAKFGAGQKVVLKFSDGEAVFFTPNAGLALGALQLCSSAAK